MHGERCLRWREAVRRVCALPGAPHSLAGRKDILEEANTKINKLAKSYCCEEKRHIDPQAEQILIKVNLN